EPSNCLLSLTLAPDLALKKPPPDLPRELLPGSAAKRLTEPPSFPTPACSRSALATSDNQAYSVGTGPAPAFTPIASSNPFPGDPRLQSHFNSDDAASTY